MRGLLTADKNEVEEEEEEAEGEEVAVSLAEQVPTEVMLKILSYLSPRDLSRCAQVSQQWNQLAMDPSLWQALWPVQWAAGEDRRLRCWCWGVVLTSGQWPLFLKCKTAELSFPLLCTNLSKLLKYRDPT